MQRSATNIDKARDLLLAHRGLQQHAIEAGVKMKEKKRLKLKKKIMSQ